MATEANAKGTGDVTALAEDPAVETTQQEKDDVRRWFREYEAARNHDKEARKQMVLDRRQARGDSSFSVDANLPGTYIDVLEAFLYAKNPDIACMPARSLEPPPIEAIREAAESTIQQGPMLEQAGRAAGAAAGIMSGGNQEIMQQAADQAMYMQAEQMVQDEFVKLQAKYAAKQRHAKGFADTLELVIAHHWRKARLKQRARGMVRSALTVAIGAMKATWQERNAPQPAPIAQTPTPDKQDNIDRAEHLAGYSAEDAPTDQAQANEDAADLARQQAAVDDPMVEPTLIREIVIDHLPPEDIQVSMGVPLARYVDAQWMAQRIPMPVDEICSQFKLTKLEKEKITTYKPRDPELRKDESPLIGNIEASDVDAYMNFVGGDAEKTDSWGMVIEIWDRESTTVLTLIEGLGRWARQAWHPPATTRFYPFFLTLISEVDGQRHPQSLICRSAKLIDEYNRIGSAERTHRMRVKPKTVFDAGGLEPGEAKKLEKGVVMEMVGIKTNNKVTDLRTILVPVQYPPMDPALYDRQRIINELERIWGVQEALAGSVNVEKTAREAEIQNSGFEARTSGKRDLVEQTLDELALYSAELLRQKLTTDEVVQICGPHAIWPEWQSAETLSEMVAVEIVAGTTGKPNTTAQREAWTAQYPLLKEGIMEIGTLRGSTPDEIAMCLERLMRITAERSGERTDVGVLIPKRGPMIMPGQPGDPNAPPGINVPGAPQPGAAPPGAGGPPANGSAGPPQTGAEKNPRTGNRFTKDATV